ncbi:MAG: GntR family transcriptional regulator [Gammaproteobacteria bacterium]
MVERTVFKREEATFRLRADILAGRWKPGQYLPQTTALAQELGTARTTIDRALSVVEQMGLLVRLHRREGPEPRWYVIGADPAIPLKGAQRVAAALRTAIQAGRWQPGDRLPPARTLMRQLGEPQLRDVRHGLWALRTQGILVGGAGPGRPFLVPRTDGATPITVLDDDTARLRAAIHAGRWQPGDRLPPADTLKKQLHTSWATPQALRRLRDDEGLLMGGGRGHPYVVANDEIDNPWKDNPAEQVIIWLTTAINTGRIQDGDRVTATRIGTDLRLNPRPLIRQILGALRDRTWPLGDRKLVIVGGGGHGPFRLRSTESAPGWPTGTHRSHDRTRRSSPPLQRRQRALAPTPARG